MYFQNGLKLKKNFKSTAKTSFDADVDSINFKNSAEAAQKINTWVKEKTNNKIDKLFDAGSFDGETRAVLLNAIYFKGDWLSPFPEDQTKTGKFYVSETKSISHPMMYQEGKFDVAANEELKAQILILKYSNPRFAMTIVLPDSRTGINDLEKKLSNIDLNTLETENINTELGLGGIFTNSADFSNMIEDEKHLVISKVLQKAFIEVNEKGSEAAAATGIQIGPRFKPPSFIADHPFIFFITATLEEKSPTTKTILFSGKVVSPAY
ncbi:serine protease inhibitor serpin [Holotrichia oblita]|uniref:Serine protease inhibitor serpin n=1 Tax=Holotrichia oblita TaxID=644536 RepID=A0ACB9SKP0_HOLOL|nr:serine protease inhibitor serpin [Holotrichia oblita]